MYFTQNTRRAVFLPEKSMLKEERFQYILDKIKANQRVLLPELSQALNVSEDTVRRDIGELSRSGLLSKVRGGAIPSRTHPFPLPTATGSSTTNRTNWKSPAKPSHCSARGRC
jgi:DeoR/GlpR family transcriptional regulator of sugar metabolism